VLVVLAMLASLRVAPGNSAPGLTRPLLTSVRSGGLPVAGRDGRTVIVLVKQKNWEKKMSFRDVATKDSPRN